MWVVVVVGRPVRIVVGLQFVVRVGVVVDGTVGVDQVRVWWMVVFVLRIAQVVVVVLDSSEPSVDMAEFGNGMDV